MCVCVCVCEYERKISKNKMFKSWFYLLLNYFSTSKKETVFFGIEAEDNKNQPY